MKQIIISLLGLSVYSKESLYKNNTPYSLSNGEYTNSIDVLLHSFEKDKFIFFGTSVAIEKHKEKFKNILEKRDVSFIKYDDKNLNDIFHKIISTLIENKENEILFDITHSFRDSVIMSVISTIVSQIVYNPTITMIYAKEEKKENSIKSYLYETVGEDILNTSNIAFILSSFISTLRIPPLNSKYELFELLNTFSIHLISNQFKEIYENDLEKLNNYIKNNKEKLFFVKPMLEELETLVNSIRKTAEEKTYNQFLFFAKLFYEKDYYLHSSTYLIEGITHYISDAFNTQGYVNFDTDIYENQQKIVALLKLNYRVVDFNFPNNYFVDININEINKFHTLRDKTANIRHNLAHININENYSQIKKRLCLLIKKFEQLIEMKVLYKLDTSLTKKEYTVKYKLKYHENELHKFVTSNTSKPKITTIVNKYNEEKLDTLNNIDSDNIKNYLSTYISEINNLFTYKKERKLLLES